MYYGITTDQSAELSPSVVIFVIHIIAMRDESLRGQCCHIALENAERAVELIAEQTY